MNSKIKTYHFIFILFLSHLGAGIFAQPINDPGAKSFLYPQRMQSGDLKYFACMSLSNLSEDVYEFEENGNIYNEGMCLKCGKKVISEIKEENN